MKNLQCSLQLFGEAAQNPMNRLIEARMMIEGEGYD